MTISVHPCSLHSHIMYVSFIKLFKSGSNCPSYSHSFVGAIVVGIVEVVIVVLDEVVVGVVVIDVVVFKVVVDVAVVVDWVVVFENGGVAVLVVVADEHKISGTLYFQSHTDKSGLNLRSEGH